jgi:hypothetical protein
MSLTLVVVQGPYVGQQIHVGSGQTVSIGRTGRANHSFPNDTYLSGAHFEVGCDEQGCRIRDLGSSNGTFINGAKIDLAVVREGDQVSAGETVFLVQPAGQEQTVSAPVLANAPPPAGQPAPVPVERTARMYAPGFEPKAEDAPSPVPLERKRTLQMLSHPGRPLFTLLDTSRDDIAREALAASSLRHEPLFDGQGADQASTRAPILVELGQTDESGLGTEAKAFLDTLLALGWGKGWGIFCTSGAPFEELLQHFRSFVLVRTREQRPLYFPFYDPRVLRAFLPVCEPQELSAIFGPVASYFVESERPDTMLAFSAGTEGLVTTQISLGEQVLQAQAG